MKTKKKLEGNADQIINQVEDLVIHQDQELDNEIGEKINLELNGNKADGTFCSAKIEVSCDEDDATLYIYQCSESKSDHMHIKFSRSDLEQFVEALKKVL